MILIIALFASCEKEKLHECWCYNHFEDGTIMKSQQPEYIKSKKRDADSECQETQNRVQRFAPRNGKILCKIE